MKRSKDNFQYFGSLFKQLYYLRGQRQLYQIACNTDEKNKDFTLSRLAEVFGKQVADRGDETLHRHKLETHINDQNQSACINKKSQTPATSKPYMCVHAEQNKHQEEADGPELRQWHQGCCLGVCDECQARTFVGRGERALLFRIKFQSKKENADDDQEFHSDKI